MKAAVSVLATICMLALAGPALADKGGREGAGRADRSQAGESSQGREGSRTQDRADSRSEKAEDRALQRQENEISRSRRESSEARANGPAQDPLFLIDTTIVDIKPVLFFDSTTAGGTGGLY